jgi:hypothetical protein
MLKIIVLLTLSVIGAVGTLIGSGVRELRWPPIVNVDETLRAFRPCSLCPQIEISDVCQRLRSLDKRVDRKNCEGPLQSENMPHLYLRGGQTAKKSGSFFANMLLMTIPFDGVERITLCL